MLTDRGRWILAFGGGVYLAAWAFGSEALYPIALGLVLAVAAAALWVRFLAKPMTLNRILSEGEHLAGDDIPVRLEVELEGRMPSGALVVRERIARLGEIETVMVNRRGRLRGSYRIDGVPRGRYAVESVDAVLEDPFGLERVELKLPAGESLLVYPRLVDLDGLFSDSGARALEGRRLLLRRPTGFDLHSVRAYEQGVATARPLAFDRQARSADGEGARRRPARRDRGAVGRRRERCRRRRSRFELRAPGASCRLALEVACQQGPAGSADRQLGFASVPARPFLRW